MNERELDQLLQAIHLERMAYPDPDEVMRHALSAPIEQTPQRRFVLPRFPSRRFQSMFSATKLAAAGAIVAVFGGFLLAGLALQPDDGRLPPAGASASATTQAESKATATTEPELTTEPDVISTPDLLPGVDLDVLAVEPGVYRVTSDGIRDLVRQPDPERAYDGTLDGNLVAGLDGSVWWFDRDGFFRLGEERVQHWPKDIDKGSKLGQDDIEVGPDGTLWMLGGSLVPGISSYDGQAWSKRWQGAATRRWAVGVEVQQDGTVWMAWSNQNGRVRAARLGDDGWEVLPGSVAPGNIRDVIVADGGGSDIWLSSYTSGRLHRHDGEGWVVEETPDLGREGRAAAGPDGTLWVQSGRASIARYAGGDWEVYDASNRIPMMGPSVQGSDGVFEVAPDRSIWFTPAGEYGTNQLGDPTGTRCDGIARFDGEVVIRFLRRTCIYAMDIAPDGSVWLQAGSWGMTGQALDEARPGPINTYVITQGSVADTE